MIRNSVPVISDHYNSRVAQRGVPSAEVASQARSILLPVSDEGSEIPLPSVSIKAMMDPTRLTHG